MCQPLAPDRRTVGNEGENDFFLDLALVGSTVGPVNFIPVTTESSSRKRLGKASVAARESQSYTTQPAPTLPFFDWNACPFEGCTYGKWTAAAAAEIFDTWKPGRKQIATLPANAVVTGLSGVVITYKPGVIRLNRDLPQDDLRRGDTILTYTSRGEGFSDVWLKGRFYGEYDITFAKWPDGSGCLGTDCAGTYVDLGEKVWWAKVKLSSGVVGWVNMNKAEFEGVDRFGFVAPGSPYSWHLRPAPSYIPTPNPNHAIFGVSQ